MWSWAGICEGALGSLRIPAGNSWLQIPAGNSWLQILAGNPGSSLNGIDIVGTKHSKETGQFEGGNADLMSREAQGDPCGERKGGNGNSGCPGWKRARELRSWG